MLHKSLINLGLLLLIVANSLVAQQANQPPKYAFIVQNFTFKPGWPSMSSIKHSSTTVVSLLRQQGFTHISTYTNLTAKEFRQQLEAFIKTLPKGAICVVYLGSHGAQTKDNTGDEQADQNDEVFICTDSPASISTVSKKVDNAKMDFCENAIIDDELGLYNEKILTTIGKEGHFLFLADFCYSDKSSKGENNQLQIRTAADWVDNKSIGRFVAMAATNNQILVANNQAKNSYFVEALARSFQYNYGSRCPNYQAFFGYFSSFLTAIDNKTDINHGVPTLETIHAKELVFKGAFKINQQHNSLVTGKKGVSVGKKGNDDDLPQIIALQVQDPFIFEEETAVEVYQGNKLLSVAKIKSIEDSTLVLTLPSKINTSDITTVAIPQKRQKASALFQTINTRQELYQVLQLLHEKNIGVKVQGCVNCYREVNGALQTQPGQPLVNGQSLTTSDNISISVQVPDTYYYNILDVTSRGIVSCYQTKTNQPFFAYHHYNKYDERDVFRSIINEPFEASALWVLVSDQNFDSEYLDTYLTDKSPNQPLNDFQKSQLWSIVKHIKFFYPLNYTVVRSK